MVVVVWVGTVGLSAGGGGGRGGRGADVPCRQGSLKRKLCLCSAIGDTERLKLVKEMDEDLMGQSDDHMDDFDQRQSFFPSRIRNFCEWILWDSSGFSSLAGRASGFNWLMGFQILRN